ncbi:hypothetical protein FYK55_02610 [Roseiconus nitratireducens]|uniref:Uncharacterized protein n=1 Tax=Roseiconus nitratireducens TaxID=2605748 RepID=A0A5M6DLM4_9BACT|nr:hypothetical protein [Roseiconus nitratireducens]KAA5547306.1 hypothetical protein FYK55_02610 [Roseiconus nitratireducens]
MSTQRHFQVAMRVRAWKSRLRHHLAMAAPLNFQAGSHGDAIAGSTLEDAGLGLAASWPLGDLLVYPPIWLAITAWFVGAWARRWPQRSVARRIYQASWLAGSLLVCLHIVASYGHVHHWSHAEVLAATADESQRVTGIRAAWGVYVNFAFALIWLGYSTAMIRHRGALPGWDRWVFGFTAMIVFFATIVFEPGTVRWASAFGFTALAIAAWKDTRKKRQE